MHRPVHWSIDLPVHKKITPMQDFIANGWNPSDIPKAEADVLVAIYNATDGENWTRFTWDFGTTAGAMDGVTVSGGHITELNIYNNGLSGDLDDILDPLADYLTVLNFYTN